MARQIVVLGIHRSGTSCVAGVLHHLGVPMGYELMEPHPNNPRGFFEDMHFVDLNDYLLQDWRQPRTRFSRKVSRLYAPHIGRRDSDFPIWGLKDPRLCITLVLFYELLSEPRFVVVERPLKAAIASMGRVYARNLGRDPRTVMRNAACVQQTYHSCLRQRMAEFPDTPTLHVSFKELVDEPNRVVGELHDFVYSGTAESATPEQLREAARFVSPQLQHFPT